MSARTCRGCGVTGLVPFLDLGRHPEANTFPGREDAGEEPRWPLVGLLCEHCWLVQLDDDTPPERTVPGLSPWASSSTMRAHAGAFVGDALAMVGGPGGTGGASDGPRIVEMASHGGHLYPLFAERGVASTVVESDPDLAAWAEQGGARVVARSFDLAAAHELAARGPADLIVDNYLLAHVRRPVDLAAGVAGLLAADGWFIIEFDHLLPVVRGRQFDVFRHGHFAYFSLTTLRELLARHGLTVVDAAIQPVYGGAVRAYVRHAAAAGPPGQRVLDILAAEREAGLDRPETYHAFAAAAAETRRHIVDFLVEQRAGGRLTVGYGAPSRGNTLLNACGVGPDLLPFTADASPAKQGRRLPGSGIAIETPDSLLAAKPDNVLILTWDIAPEIVRQLAAVPAWGGRFLVPIPDVEVVG